MARHKDLQKAHKEKNDEFYTRIEEVSAEMRYYRKHFKDKIIFCNCDDPVWSAFWKYFHLNFEELGLKKLISTHYDKEEPTYKMEYFGGNDNDTEDGIKTPLEGNGDFRNAECIELLKEADIIVTNPPFSLFREYVAQLMEYNKNFIIIGNINAITYKEFFPLLKENKIWIGASIHSGDRMFYVPDDYPLKASGCGIDETGRKWIKVKGVRWFTNLDYPQRHEKIILWKEYNEEEFPTYDNYNAINIDKTAEIPKDFDGFMGVPVTYMDKHNPEQFEIIGLLQSSSDEQAGTPNLRYYNDFKEMRQDMTFTGSRGGKANGNPVLAGKSKKGNFLYNEKTGEYVHSVYARILIRRKNI